LIVLFDVKSPQCRYDALDVTEFDVNADTTVPHDADGVPKFNAVRFFIVPVSDRPQFTELAALDALAYAPPVTSVPRDASDAAAVDKPT
jgi:hypothetical protein